MKCPECDGSGQTQLTINSGTLVKGAINWLPNVRGRRRTSFWSQLSMPSLWGTHSSTNNNSANSALIYAAVFGYAKELMGRAWSEHTTDAQYQEAVNSARQLLLRLREQLQWRPRR